MARSDWNRPPLSPLPEGLRRIRLDVSYDGSAFHGWQSQDNGISVQQVLESAIRIVTGYDLSVQGSGRTDAGVHALMQVCHFDVPVLCTIPAERFCYAINTHLPSTVKVLSSSETDGSFHSRFTTMAREYRYFVKSRKDMLPFDVGYVATVPFLPSLSLLEEYAACIRGKHDFTTFTSSKDTSTSRYRDIYESFWSESLDKYGFRLYCYTVCGNAFLYHQVRSMAGTMLQFAREERSADEFRAVLEAKDRRYAGVTAPPDGLYLARISYDEDEYAWFEEESGNG